VLDNSIFFFTSILVDSMISTCKLESDMEDCVLYLLCYSMLSGGQVLSRLYLDPSCQKSASADSTIATGTGLRQQMTRLPIPYP
jgi:hypothetical protein